MVKSDEKVDEVCEEFENKPKIVKGTINYDDDEEDDLEEEVPKKKAMKLVAKPVP